MELNLQSLLPSTLEEAVETLKTFYNDGLDEIKQMTEREFMSSTHFGAGMFIRNQWFLWWYEGHDYPDKWPAEKPKLNKMFNDAGIVHADDMSGIILTSMYRSICGIDINFDGQVKYYQNFWKNNGFPDGIPKP